MSYVEENLIAGEQALFRGTIHWIIYVPAMTLLFYGLLALSLGLFSKDDTWLAAISYMTGISLPFCALFSFIRALIMQCTTELSITNKRVIAKTGLIKRDTIELNHSQVESFSIHQTIIGRLLNFGTLIIHGTGGTVTPIQSIKAPLVFRRKAMEAIEKTES